MRRALRPLLGGIALASITLAGACGDDDESSGAPDAAADAGGAGASGGTSSGGSAGQDGSAGASGGAGGVSGGDSGSDADADAGGAAGAFNCDPGGTTLPSLKLTEIVNVIPSPSFAESPLGDTTRLFIGSVNGFIRIRKNGALLPSTFLDIQDRVLPGGERGLLGLAFHPGYEQNGRFFVHYSADGTTAPSGDTVISEFSRSASDPDLADASSEKLILTHDQPYDNHNGGAIHFKSGLLFIGLGDGGSGGDPLDNGQSTDTLLGKMLRIDVDNPSAGKPYGIPSGNMSGSGVSPELWSYGLRNPWRWSFDPCTGDQYIADVGQNAWEEINVEPAGTPSGTNWGWRVMEGMHCFNPINNCDMTGKMLPVAEYDHGQGCSVTGGYVYRGSAIAALRGWYLYADYCSGRFWAFRYAAGAAQDVQEITDDINPGAAVKGIASFGQDASGELYVMAYSGGSRVFRIDPE